MTQIVPARKNTAIDTRIRRQKQDCMDVFIQININGRSEQVVLKEYWKSDTSLHLFTLL